MHTLVTVIIRTLNEARHLGSLLHGIAQQRCPDLEIEIVVVDSGSTDDTLVIAHAHGCRIVHITRELFSFGRSLNVGCEVARGDLLVIVSGHCVPTDENWLKALCAPLIKGQADYTYGRQIGGPNSRFSECRIFAKYFPAHSKIPQDGFFCNNANSAIRRQIWAHYRFNEDLTGLEDMDLARRLTQNGGKLAYIAEACVIHHHEERWRNVKRRFEREAIALQRIMPQIHIHRRDLIRYIIRSIWLDLRKARSERQLLARAYEIVRYRVAQYWGSYVGNHNHRKLSRAQKDEYFYPDESRNDHETQSHRIATNEGQ